MKNKIHLFESIENNKIQTDILLSLIPLIFVSSFFYGIRVIVLISVTIFYGLLSDYIINFLKSRKDNIIDMSTINNCIILCLLLPVTMPYWVVSIFNLISNIICKHIMGSRNILVFNQAALSFCFLAIFFPNFTYLYPEPFSKVDLIVNDRTNLIAAPFQVLKEYGVPNLSIDDMILGNYAGPMGASFILVILSCSFFLILRKRIQWQVPVTFLGTIVIFSLLIPRIITGSIDSVIYETLSQPMIFIAFFIISDDLLLPKKYESKILYAFTLGILSMAFEYNSPYYMATMFAILLLSPMTEYFDRVITPFVLKIDFYELYYNIYKKVFGNSLKNKGIEIEEKIEEKIENKDNE